MRALIVLLGGGDSRAIVLIYSQYVLSPGTTFYTVRRGETVNSWLIHKFRHVSKRESGRVERRKISAMQFENSKVERAKDQNMRKSTKKSA